MRKSIIAILSLVGMVACTNDVTVKTQAPAPIAFGDSFVEVKTRAAADPSITTATIDAFDVWGFMDDPNGLMYDAQRVTKGEAGWSYSPLQYWLQDHNYFFYAVAPVGNPDIVVHKDLNIEGLGTIDFTNTDGSVDLLYAEKQESTYNEDVNADGHETVKFTFAHLLSKVKFTFTNGFPEGTSSLKIENIKISKAPSKGTVTLNDDNAGRTWKITDSNATLDFGHVNGGVALLPNESAECDNERLTIPADANVRYQIDFTATLYYGENVALTSEKTVYLEDQAFVIGKNYNIKVTIDDTNIAEEALSPIIFDVVEVEDWELGEHNGKIDFDNDGTQVNPGEPVAPTALATPVVTAVAKENNVTLSWEAVENAASYSITVGTEMPVFVEETTYVFTGEYETEYTFNVVAVPADEEKFAASEAAVVKATTEAAPVVEPEVLAELDADAYYIFKQATEMKGGKWYAIVYENKAATGLTGNYGYIQPTEAASRANGISLPATCAFGFLTTEGGYTIQQFDGKYVYQTGTYDSFNVNANLPADGGVWSVAVEGNEYTITNNTMSKFVQYDPAYNSYGCYAASKGNLPTLYELVEVDNTPAILGVSPGSLSFAADGESKTITVSTYGVANLTVSESADWVSTSLAENIVTVTVDANSGEARETTLTLSYGEDSKEVTITQVAPSTGESYTVTYDFTQIDGFSSWSSSYSEHIVEYNEATVCFEKANKQSTNITNMPVTKGNSVTLVAKNNATITAAAFECKQWTTKAQTITLYYSTDGGNTYTSTNITSTDFSIEASELPEGTNAVKIGFSNTNNQVGIKSATITYK
jgi:hypothetical protein